MKQDLNSDGKVTMQEKILAALASYGRHFLGAAIALYMTGNTDPGDLLKGYIASYSKGPKSKRNKLWVYKEGII
jgi:hypothetical protein